MRFNKNVLMIIILFATLVYIANNTDGHSEGYDNLFALSPENATGGNYLLKGLYPISKNPVSTKQYSQEWYLYPSFSIPSFKQMTNNLKYYSNPSIARESPEDFLDTFYDSKTSKSNIIDYGNFTPIVTPNNPRVGYWNTKVDAMY